MKILIINGPNINLLGKRETNFYGNLSIKKIRSILLKKTLELNIEIFVFQSNLEGEIIELIHESFIDIFGLIINPGGYTHNSVAIHDILAMLDIPIIEVHVSNIHSREHFRKKSVLSNVITGQVSGFGIFGYIIAFDEIINIFRQSTLSSQLIK